MIKFPLLITIICTGLLLFACSKPAEEVAKQAVIEEKKPVFETYSAEEFFKTTSVSGSSINADASAVLISNDKRCNINLHFIQSNLYFLIRSLSK